MSFPNKPLPVSNGISVASDKEYESLMDDSKGVDLGGQAESRSNEERCVGTYSNKSRIVRIIAAAASVLYLFVIKLNRPHKLRTKRNTISTGAVALTKHAIPLASAAAKLERLRFDLATISIDMMRSDMATDANISKFIDIGPLYDLVESALEEVGIWGVCRELLEAEQFIASLTAAAQAKDVHGLSVKLNEKEGKQPFIQYTGVPNDREFYQSDMQCNGCKWWLDHYIGAIAADVLMRKGSLKLDSNGEESVSDAAAIMHELQKMQRLKDTDISTHHVGHGFTWQYIAVTMNRMNAYPMVMAKEFCGDLLWKDDYHSRFNNDIGRECRHGFGHAVFYALAIREIGGLNAYSVRKQVRPVSGFQLSNKSMCEGYQICLGAPNDKTWDDCIGGLRHSDKLLADGMDQKVFNFERTC
jgi:hypothetical protein